MNITRHIVTSANWDTGRGGKEVTGIVLHTMVGYLQSSEDLFNNPSHAVSVHYGIGMDGSIRQWVDEANTAWQAGNHLVNQTTIGIEHEDFGNANDSVRTQAEYEASSDLVAAICKRYKFPADSCHVFLHKNVIDTSSYPGGTACPDGLDTNKIIAMAAAKLKRGDDNMPIDGKLATQEWQRYYGTQMSPKQYKDYTSSVPQYGFYKDIADDKTNALKSQLASGEEVTKAFIHVLGREPSKGEFVKYTNSTSKVLNDFLYSQVK